MYLAMWPSLPRARARYGCQMGFWCGFCSTIGARASCDWLQIWPDHYIRAYVSPRRSVKDALVTCIRIQGSGPVEEDDSEETCAFHLWGRGAR